MNLLSPSTHLLLVLLMPLVGAGIVWLASSRGLQAVRTSAATTAVLTLVATGLLILRYLMSDEALSNQVFAMASLPWLTGGMFNIHLSIGLDGLSLWLFGLSALLSLTAIFVSWEAVTERAAG